MTTPTATADRARAPMWFLRLKQFDRATIVLTVLATVTEVTLILLRSSNGGVAGLFVTALGVAVSRRWRWAGLALVVAGPFINSILGFDPTATWTIAVFTAFSVTLRGLRAVGVGVFVGVTVYLSVMLSAGIGWFDPSAFATLAMSFAAAAAGSALRNQHRYWNELEQRAQDAIANRESEANRRVTEERLRIARDLHDVMGHQIAILNMHLGVAEVNLPANPATSLVSLDDARGNVQEILQETQRILHVLRSDDRRTDDALRPAPDLAGIPALIETFRAGGLAVEAQVCRTPDALDPEVSSAAFRIVQESLTNAQKHGTGGARVRVDTENAGVLVITVTNRKPERTAGASKRRGFGLVGMRERASSAGGRLRIDDDARTFAVQATLRTDGGAVR